jgi:hypothetical protein
MAPPEAIWSSKSCTLYIIHSTDGVDPQALAEYYTQYAIPLRPQAGILVLSIIVSILGSYATLLCLGRRTSSRGWRNHILLFASALCFAAVAVWGMHFVSMVSTRLRPSPEVVWYLQVCLAVCLEADDSSPKA